MRALAVDLGGTHASYGVVEDQRLLCHEVLDVERSTRLRAVMDVLDERLRVFQDTYQDCIGLAVGFPGIVNTDEARVLSTLKKYEDAIDIDLSCWAASRFGLRVRIDNDARMALLGEQFAGAGRGSADIVMMTLGTGIGTAAMIHGRLLRGAHFHAGCLGGHIVANAYGRLCHCGNIGCAESEASGWTLPAIARSWPGFDSSSLADVQAINFFEVFTLARAGDQVALEVRDHCVRIWATTAVSLIHTYDPQVVVIGGGVMASGDEIIPAIQSYVDRHVWSTWGKPKVCAAKLGNKAALLGAIPLLIED